MYGFLLALLILDGLILGVVILLQSGKGGGLAAMGGGVSSPAEGILGGRQATNLLTRATWVTGSTFMVLSLVLSILSSRAAAPESILRPEMPQAPQQVLPLLNEGGEPGGEGGEGEAEGGNAPGN